MKSNNILLIILTLVLFAAAYWYFFTGTTGNEPPLTASVEENQAATQFKMLVTELSTITFNTDIAKDPRFNALVDFTTPISPESAGRLDPLAPIPGVSGQ